MSYHLSTCRSCGQLIDWDTTKNGKRVPIDPSGMIHFVTCPARKTGGKVARKGGQGS